MSETNATAPAEPAPLLRLTPEVVRAAYAASGLQPARGSTYTREGDRLVGGCPLGAVAWGPAAARGGSQPTNFDVTGAVGLPRDYQAGFIHGWDGREPDDDYRGSALELWAYQVGLEDGRACLEALAPEYGLATGPATP